MIFIWRCLFFDCSFSWGCWCWLQKQSQTDHEFNSEWGSCEVQSLHQRGRHHGVQGLEQARDFNLLNLINFQVFFDVDPVYQGDQTFHLHGIHYVQVIYDTRLEFSSSLLRLVLILEPGMQIQRLVTSMSRGSSDTLPHICKITARENAAGTSRFFVKMHFHYFLSILLN